jgi:hypothetical protein
VHILGGEDIMVVARRTPPESHAVIVCGRRLPAKVRSWIDRTYIHGIRL